MVTIRKHNASMDRFDRRLPGCPRDDRNLASRALPDYRIRAARADEAARLSALARRSKAHWGYPEAFLKACRGELTFTARQIDSPRYRFAVIEAGDRRPAGFYALERVAPAAAELSALFVEPRHIGHGYGRALMAHACREAAALGASSLIIQADPNAERFYRAAGGIPIGRRESSSIPGRFLPVFRISLSV